jgi:hypothetical protein
MQTAARPPRQVSALLIELPAFTRFDKTRGAYVTVPAQTLRAELSIDLAALATRLAWHAQKSPRSRASLAAGTVRLTINARELHPDRPLPPADGTLDQPAVYPAN